MSRLNTLSPEAIRAMFSSDSSETLIALISISVPNLDPIRLSDNYTHRIEYLNATQCIVTPVSTRTTQCTYTINGTSGIITITGTPISSGSIVDLNFISGSGVDGSYTVTSTAVGSFSITHSSLTTSGSVLVTYSKSPFTYTYNTTDDILKDAINSNSEELFYGTYSNGKIYLFLPFELSLPTEEANTIPRCKLSLYDVTRMMTPIIRQLSETPTVDISIILSSLPDEVQISFPSFLMGSISYNAESIQAELTIESFVSEPFPCHSFTPTIFPGLF